jgi:hemoglobin-like flavoprotein
MDLADTQLTGIFSSQNAAIKSMNTKFESTLIGYAEQFENELKRLAEEMKARRAEIVAQIDQKFSIADIHREFSNLEKLAGIESLLATLTTQVSDAKMQQIIDATRQGIESVKSVLSDMNTELQANAQATASSEQLERGLAPLQRLADIEATLRVVSNNSEQDRTLKALLQTQRELNNLRATLENAVREMRTQSPMSPAQPRAWWPFR